MAIKRIIVKTRQQSRWFKWWDSDGELGEDSDGRVGFAAKLADAIELAKAHTGRSDPVIVTTFNSN